MTSRRTFGYVRKLPSKKYQASYIGADGNRYNAPYTFNNKSEANSWLAEEESMLRKGTWTSPTGENTEAGNEVNFFDYATRHINIQTNKDGELLRPSTKALYERLLATKLKPFHACKLTEVKTADVANWWAAETASGKRTSASKAYKLMYTVLKRATEEELLIVNPCKVKGAQAAVTGKTVPCPTPDHLNLIAKHINPRYTMIVLLAAYAGLRYGEVTALRNKDFVTVERSQADGSVVRAYEIRISRAVTLVKGEFIFAAPKTKAGVRAVPVTSLLTSTLDMFLEEAPTAPEALVFPAATGGPQRHDVFMNSWNPALKRAGLEKSGYTPHTLRHFAGTYMAKAGANLPELKQFLGDSSTQAVMRYIHATNRNDLLVEAMDFAF